MKRSNRMNWFQAAFAFLLIAGFLQAELGGGYTGSPFRYGSNARGIALAGAMVAVPNQGFQQFANPALISNVEKMELGISLFTMSLDRSVQAVSFSRVLPPKGAIGLTFFRAGTSNIQGRNLQGQKTEMMSVSDSYGMLTFGLEFKHGLSAGLNFKAMFNDIDGELSGKGVAIDVGLLYEMHPNLVFGAQFTSVTGKTAWSDEGATVEEELPRTFSLGARYSPLENWKVMGQYDAYLIQDHGTEGAASVAVEGLVLDILYLRAGLEAGSSMSNSMKEEFDLDFSLGLGVVYPVWKLRNLRFDYAIDPGNKGEGLSHLISWSFLL